MSDKHSISHSDDHFIVFTTVNVPQSWALAVILYELVSSVLLSKLLTSYYQKPSRYMIIKISGLFKKHFLTRTSPEQSS